MARLAIHEYEKGTYDKIVIGYTDYVSALTQTPQVKQILPLTDVNSIIKSAAEFREEAPDSETGSAYGLTFEPNPAEVLDILLPRLVEMQIYQAILESDASEHSARMVAMRSASDAAIDLIKELQYNYNKARQAAITQEISEIVGGAGGVGIKYLNY